MSGVAAVASAPGKVFVAGEYAVLDGAPALVAALELHAAVRLSAVSGPGPVLVESALEGRWSGDADPGAARGDAAAILAALAAATAALPALAGMRVAAAVDSRAFLRGERKLGLGRSAATLTAAVAGLLAAAGGEREQLLELALAAHARLQGGLGSGADVAAAVHGGVIVVRRTAARLAVTPCALPPGLRLLVGWTGEAAPTVPLLESFARARSPRALAALAATAEEAADAAERGDAEALLEAVEQTAAHLEALGETVGLPIVTPALRRLVGAARRAGAAAKPAGAGGGDCGIALARSAAEAEAVRAAWQAAGIVPLEVGIAAAGAHAALDTAAGRGVALG